MEDIIKFHKIVGQKLGLAKSVIQRSIMLNLSAAKSHHFKDKPPDAVSAASIYLVSRTSNTPQTLKAMSDACNVSRKDVARCYRLLIRTKDGFKPDEMSKRQRNKILSFIDSIDFFIECPKCLGKSLLYHNATDIFRCSTCNASWKRFE